MQSPRLNQGMPYNKKESKSCFYCDQPWHLIRDYQKKKSDEARNKTRKHTGHFAKDSSEHDLRLFNANDDYDEPPNFDSRDLRLFVSNAALSAKTDDSDAWFVDSGASVHMTCNKKWFTNFKEKHNGANIYLGDDRTHQIKG